MSAPVHGPIGGSGERDSLPFTPFQPRDTVLVQKGQPRLGPPQTVQLLLGGDWSLDEASAGANS